MLAFSLLDYRHRRSTSALCSLHLGTSLVSFTFLVTDTAHQDPSLILQSLGLQLVQLELVPSNVAVYCSVYVVSPSSTARSLPPFSLVAAPALHHLSWVCLVHHLLFRMTLS